LIEVCPLAGPAPARRLPEPGEHDEVGVNPHAVDSAGAKRYEAHSFLAPSELLLNRCSPPTFAVRTPSRNVRVVSPANRAEGGYGPRGRTATSSTRRRLEPAAGLRACAVAF